jgi:hypothetical protein
MRAHALLSPHRTRRGDEDSHDWQIITEAPNSMWAIDASRIDAVRDGKVRLFATVEQWNAAFPSGHVTKRGTRFEASRAPSRAVRQQFGPLSAGAARGLARRHDHGSTFMTDHVQNRVQFRGLSPGHACVAEPESNAVIERLFRTFKEQVVHCRVFETLRSPRPSERSPPAPTPCGGSRRTAASARATPARRVLTPPSAEPQGATMCPDYRVHYTRD